MAQVKKAEVHAAILSSAYTLFKKKGFLTCKMSEIASRAGTATSNMYVYFPSKVHLFYEVYTPIITAQLNALSKEVEALDDERQKVRLILFSIWHDMPRENNFFAHNLMEAIMSTTKKEDKPHELLKWSLEVINDLLLQSVPKKRKHLFSDTSIAFLIQMAFDGFILNAKVENLDMLEGIVDRFTSLLLGD